jgi:hypothetical protein
VITTRRLLALLGLTVAVVLGAGVPANATFSDSVALPAMSVGTGTVAPAAGVRAETTCRTTTTVVTRNYRISGWAPWLVPYSRTQSTITSTSNVESNTVTRSDSLGYYTLTRTIQDTELYVTLTWSESATRGVVGYSVQAHLADGSSYVLGRTNAPRTSLHANDDASVLDQEVRLSVRTLTSHGWTADSALTAPLTC